VGTVELLLVDDVELLLVDDVELLLVELLDGVLDVNGSVVELLPFPVIATPVTVPGELDDV
jgi:hypothetical protein